VTDGNITAAKQKLTHSITRLTAPRPAIHGTTTLYQPSLYTSLEQDLGGTTNGKTSHAASKSMPPLWIDAADLLTRMDAQTYKWVPKRGTTPQRLEILGTHTWRPQDTDYVNGIAGTVNQWCDNIQGLLDPKASKHIAAPCPACGQQNIKTKDSGGDVVRRPVLKIMADTGCTCQACNTFWAPEQFVALSKQLGFLPASVLE
jgi:hypothetical protein